MFAIIPHKDIPDIRIEVIKTFIAAGAGLSIKNKWDDSAMDLVAKSNYPEVKKFFNRVVEKVTIRRHCEERKRRSNL